MSKTVAGVDDLAARIPNGAKLALFKDNGVPMAIGRAMVKRQLSDLHLVTVPTGALLADVLIGAGCVSVVETSGVSLGEFGLAPRFVEAVKNGTVRVLDATCPAIYAALQAAQKGIPFMPIRGLIGSDLLASRADFKLIDNPFAEQDPIVALPAIKPDVAVFHAPMADRVGNVYIGRQAEYKILAQASRSTLVSVEKIVDFNLLEDEQYAPACLNSFYVDALAVVPGGARPLNLPGYYGVDTHALKHYAQVAQTQRGFEAWLADFLAQSSDVAA